MLELTPGKLYNFKKFPSYKIMNFSINSLVRTNIKNLENLENTFIDEHANEISKNFFENENNYFRDKCQTIFTTTIWGDEEKNTLQYYKNPHFLLVGFARVFRLGPDYLDNLHPYLKNTNLKTLLLNEAFDVLPMFQGSRLHENSLIKNGSRFTILNSQNVQNQTNLSQQWWKKISSLTRKNYNLKHIKNLLEKEYPAIQLPSHSQTMLNDLIEKVSL